MFLEQFPSRTFYIGSNSRYIVDWLVLEFPEIMERGGLQKRNSIYSRYNVEWLVLENLEIMKEGGLEIGNSKYSR